MDTATSDIRAVEFTHSSDGDSPILPELLGQIPENEKIGTVTADGASDTRRLHAAITERQAVPFGHSFGPVAVMPSLPIRKNGRTWKEDCPAAKARNETLRATKHYGRAFWKHCMGTTPGAAWRRRCEVSRHSAKNVSQPETPTARP